MNSPDIPAGKKCIAGIIGFATGGVKITIPPASEPRYTDGVIRDIKLRREELAEQLEHGEISRPLYHALYAELGWVLHIIDHHNRQEG